MAIYLYNKLPNNIKTKNTNRLSKHLQDCMHFTTNLTGYLNMTLDNIYIILNKLKSICAIYSYPYIVA